MFVLFLCFFRRGHAKIEWQVAQIWHILRNGSALACSVTRVGVVALVQSAFIFSAVQSFSFVDICDPVARVVVVVHCEHSVGEYCFIYSAVVFHRFSHLVSCCTALIVIGHIQHLLAASLGVKQLPVSMGSCICLPHFHFMWQVTQRCAARLSFILVLCTGYMPCVCCGDGV